MQPDGLPGGIAVGVRSLRTPRAGSVAAFPECGGGAIAASPEPLRMLLTGPSRVASRRRRGTTAFLTVATPVSPQPPGVPLVVSGTYGGTPSGIRVVWRQGGAEVGAAVAASVIAGGTWSATITTPATPGTYTLFAAFEGGGPTAESAPVTISTSAPATLAQFTFEGTGLGANTIALFGHGFERGTLAPTDPVVLRSAGDTLHRTQMNVLATWDDGSVKTALLAGELPALADGATLGVEFVRGLAHPDPGPNLSFASALSGRSALIRTWAPGNTTTPLWTFDVAAAALTATDRWHQGPLALSTRVETPVPPTAVQNTAGQTGQIASVRLVVDVIVTKDGFLELDVCFSNDRLPFRGSPAEPIPTCGIARFGYTIEIDGQIVYDQRPASGAARDLLQWSQWIRRRGRRADGTPLDHWGSSHRPFFRPDFDLLVRSRLALNYDRQQPPANQSVANHYADGAARLADPYWHWGLARSAGDTGGRPEIGWRTEAAASWLAWPTRQAEIITHRQFEAAATRPMYYRDWALGKWASHEDYPRLALPGSASESSAPGTLRAEAVGVPSDQKPTHNTTDHITIDAAHHGSFNWTPALLSGRRLAYDGLAARVFWSNTGGRYNGTDNPFGAPSWRNTTRDLATGIRVGSHPWAAQTRSEAWGLRDHVDALAIWPEALPQRDFAEELLVGWANAWKHASETWIATRFPPAVQEVLGLPIMHANIQNCERPFMTSFFMYAVFQMLRLGLGGPNLPVLATKWFRMRTGWYDQADLNHRAFLGDQGMTWGQTATGPWPTSWADMNAMINIGVAGQHDPPNPAPNWRNAVNNNQSWNGLGDYARNRLNNLAMIAYGLEPDAAAAIPLAIRARAADALALLRSERFRPGPTDGNAPRIGSTAFGIFFNTCAICPPGNTWRTEAAPVIVPGQAFQIAADAPAGTVIGLVRTTGPFPRNSAPGRGVADAWEIVSQPAGNPIAVSEGGVLRVANAAVLGTAPFEVTLRCRTFHQDNWGDPNIEHVSALQTVTVVPVNEPPSIAPAGPFTVGSNAAPGALVGQLTVSGTEPITLAIVAGDPMGRFIVDTPSREIRVAASLADFIGQNFLLTVRATGPLASADRTIEVQVTAAVFPPVWNITPQVRAVEDLAPAGTELAPLDLGGSLATQLTILSGNTNATFEAVAPNILRVATPPDRGTTPEFLLTVRAANSAGQADGTVSVTVTPVQYVWGLTDTVVLAAYSVSRRVRPSYTGPLFRLRRAADGAEIDVGFNPVTGLINEAGLADWISGGVAEVVVWYDQSPRAQHLVPVSATLRPRLTDGTGAVWRYGANNRPAIWFDGGRGFVRTNFATLGGSRIGLFCHLRRLGVPAATGRGRIVSFRAGAGGGEDTPTGFWVGPQGNDQIQLRHSTWDAYVGAIGNNQHGFVAVRIAGGATDTARRLVVNANTNAPNSFGNTGPFANPSHLRVGTNSDDAATGNFLIGLIGELAITELLDWAADIAAVRTSMQGHFG